VLLVSGIARPGEFETAVRRLELAITGTLRFADHHRYPEATLREIATAFREGDADFVLTTSKDRVKLLGRLDLPLAELPLRTIPQDAFWPWLEERLTAARPGGARR
jgi:tetraacyldisaccharide-1-P 4'-kinase